MRNLPVDDDLQTQIEAELAASGRTDLAPKEGLVGAHSRRRESTGADVEANQRSRLDEPMGGGAVVAPTERAAVRERERHKLQREAGVVAAGEEGNLRQRRAPTASRKSLDDAARDADRKVK
jgi:hypothetical protein